MTTLFSVFLIPAEDTLPLESIALEVTEESNIQDLLEERVASLLGGSTKLVHLLLPGSESAGLYVYSIVHTAGQKLSKNVRATRLAMACGNLSTRFHGNVILFRSRGGGRYEDLFVDEIYGAACISPDLRPDIQESLSSSETFCLIPEWLANAAQQNYHDTVTISRLASVMNPSMSTDEESTTDGDVDDTESMAEKDNFDRGKHFVARTSLCLYCRGPCDSLCPYCEGAYFCKGDRQCRQDGWSHDCLCSTWKLYTDRRVELSTFPFHKWHLRLLSRDCQISDDPYQHFLSEHLGIKLDESSWWRTELHGWAGGNSTSAQTVDATVRRTYQEGFAPVTQIPLDEPISVEDFHQLGAVSRNTCGLLELDSWHDYYLLRRIPLSSPVALLLTFPITIYYAIVKYGEVPVTVAKMLKRPLRIHVVGIEKEMNFLDIFREVGCLLTEDMSVELVFVVRRDMLPPKSREEGSKNEAFLKLNLTGNLTLFVVSGTYGDDLDPNFDCGNGPPDMVIGLNAGLFAYDSWRSVINYLRDHKGVVGVFTDYNEHSGMHCASLGGAKSRSSLCVNPFRQPRAMSVLSMNLPQFSNGFMYVFNEQELE